MGWHNEVLDRLDDREAEIREQIGATEFVHRTPNKEDK